MEDFKIDLTRYLPKPDERGREDQALKKACKEFESVFTYQLLKTMRRTIEKCDLFHGGQGEEIYESFLDQELSKNVAGSGHHSMAELLYRQLRPADASLTEPGKGIQGYQDAGSSNPSWPLKARVSSEFGWRRDPIHGRTAMHRGIDLAAKEGTVIRASLPGRVITSESRGGYGNLVVLDHGRGLTTLYGHNQLNLVREGDWVEAGSPVGRVGSSGRSTGPHLHFEIRRHGKHLDPRLFLGGEA